eukprot:364301-Chlamydomonas_euryale.AAC.2
MRAHAQRSERAKEQARQKPLASRRVAFSVRRLLRRGCVKKKGRRLSLQTLSNVGLVAVQVHKTCHGWRASSSSQLHPNFI